jgi:methylmalonyl-CoA mutase
MNENTNEKRLFEEFPPISTEAWEAIINTDLKGADYDKKLIWKTYEGIAVKPYYRTEDLEKIPYLESLPGHYPYVRGNKESGNSWEIRQNIYEKNIIRINEIARDIAEKGVEGIGLDFSGVLDYEDLQLVLEGINLERLKLHITHSVSYSALFHDLIRYAESKSFDLFKLKGSLNFDPLGYLVTTGDFWMSFDDNLQEAATLIKHADILPGFKVLTINAQHFHNAGSSLTQELAFGLSMAVDYLDGLTSLGFSIDEITPRIQFVFATGSDYFMEIARLRAARLLWARIVEEFQPEDPESMKMHILSTSSNWNKSLYDPYVNLLRSTTEAMSAAIGGADAIQIDPYDVGFRVPDPFSMRVARNQQIILKEESWLDKVADMSAGSYYIEKLTESIANESWKKFQEIESKGGFLSCFKIGLIQDDIEVISNQKQQDIASRKTTILGTNQYPNSKERMCEFVDEDFTEPQPETPYRPIKFYRASESFDLLRLKTEKFQLTTGYLPKVFLFTYGNLAMRKARAMFSTNFFACSGFGISDNPGFATIQEGVEACLLATPDIVVICSSDEEYPELVPIICKSIKINSKPPRIVLAGYPKEHIEQFRTDGVDEFIHIKSNVLEMLMKFQEMLGI